MVDMNEERRAQIAREVLAYATPGRTTLQPGEITVSDVRKASDIPISHDQAYSHLERLVEMGKMEKVGKRVHDGVTVNAYKLVKESLDS